MIKYITTYEFFKQFALDTSPFANPYLLSHRKSFIYYLRLENGPSTFTVQNTIFNSLGVLPDMNNSLTLARGAKELGARGFDRSSATI